MKIVKDLVLPVLLWCGVAAYILYASNLSRSRLAETVVERIDIEIVDSSEQRRLVTGAMVADWVEKSGIGTLGESVREVDIDAIERAIADNGFVGGVAAYTSASGTLHIEVSQRTPMVRLLVDGYNRYVTSDGFVFGTPASSTMYVPVITGSYRPPFPADFEGQARICTDTLVHGAEGLDMQIRRLEKERAEILERRAEIYAHLKKHSRTKPKKGRFERKSRWDERKKWATAGWEEARRQKLDSIKRNEEETARIDARLAERIETRKKTYKNYEDFVKLLNFVETMEDDGFWRAEIVQIIAGKGSGGELYVNLIPRSGSFTIEFGEIENVGEKFARLMRFYRDGLRSVGWDAYSSISVAYEGQVVCRK